MPSKSKKQSKSASKLSKSDQTPTSTKTSSSLTTNSDSELTEDDIFSSLQAASTKYPSLISTTAFVGRITEGVVEESKGCNIWLSESSMLSSSITPGSIVSVSLLSERKKFSNSSPLSSLADECAMHFGFQNKKADEVGSYFALATVFPSCKVLNNGVRLSSNLQFTMGSPAPGRLVFVYPIHTRPLTYLVSGNGISNNTTTDLSFHMSKEIFLEVVSSSNGSTVKNNLLSFNSSQVENGTVSSPRTPFSKSKYIYEDASYLSNQNVTPVDSFDFNEVLEDLSAKKLMETCASSWLCSRNLLSGNFVIIPMLSKMCVFQVVSNHDLLLQDSNLVDLVNYAFLVDRGTKVCLSSHSKSSVKMDTSPRGISLPRLEFEQHKDLGANAGVDIPKLGGVSKEYAVLKEIVSSSMKSTLSSFCLRPTRGVLLHGPPGTGKTCLARLCAHDAGVNLFTINGPEIITQHHGESEQALHEVFESASQAAPSVVFIDELDAIAPARKEGGDELSQRMVATLLNLMDGVSRRPNNGLLVIAATNRPDSIEPALRRPGRLDREIEIGVPSPNQRSDILLALLSKMQHTLLDIEVHNLAMATHGFVAADLASLCNEAALVCLRRYIQVNGLNCDRSSVINDDQSNGIMEMSDSSCDTELRVADNLDSSCSSNLDGANDDKTNGECAVKEKSLRVDFEDFEKARMKVRPSAMKEVILEVPKVNWKDVGGQEEVKMQLMEAVEWPQKHQEAFKRIGTRPPTGVLLFGPPGCSKTLLARAVASEAGLNFLAVKGPELFSKWVGESEKAVRSLFAKARANAPSIIFFDEIDGLAVIRGKESDGVSVSDRVMSQLLVELDGLHQRVNVTVIAATNRPDKIDLALLRPGRFDRLLYVGPPNEADREDIFRIHLLKMSCSYDVCVKELAHLTQGCTGADISQICREAAVAAIEESLDASEITMQHLKSAIKQVEPSEIQSYDELLTKFQRLVHSTSTRDDLVDQPCAKRGNWIPFSEFVKSVVKYICRIAAIVSWSNPSIST